MPRPRQIPLLPTPWTNTVTGELVAVGDARDLIGMLDAFVTAAWPVGDPPRLGVADRVGQFVDRWGPWAACQNVGHLHRPLALPMPSADRPAPPWRKASEPLESVLTTAQRVNALRAIAALERLPATEDLEPARANATLVMTMLLMEDAGGSSVKDLLNRAAEWPPESSRDLFDRWLVGWLNAADVGLAPSAWSDGAAPRAEVCGVSGALAVALLVERSLPLRVGLCRACATTYRVGKDWTPDHLIGGWHPTDGVETWRYCKTCWYRTDKRRRRAAKKEGASS